MNEPEKFVTASAYGCAPLPPPGWSDKFDVWLINSGPALIQTIKTLCSFGFDLKDAKVLAKSAPCCIKIGVDLKTANVIRDQFEAVGAVIQLR